ncbi:uncharacterized protein [Periplaneta americana]|uniref:uncharacterized protein isoform X1 n=1 Tax=Periplaneta americana TaxID=6978 RepID=UPI0037E7C3C2
MAPMKLFTAVAFISVMACILGISEGGLCNYYLIPTRLDEMRTDETMIKMSNMKVVRVNKTLSMIKGTIDLMQDFPQDAICSVAGDQNVGGGPLNIPPTNCCEFFANDTTVWPPLRDALGFPMKCPIKEGTYELKGFHMNMCNLPDTLPPPKEGMMEVTVTMKDKEMLHVKGYAEIKRSGLLMRR